MADDLRFVLGITNLPELAEQRGLVYSVSPDGFEEFVSDHAGTILIRSHLKQERMRPPKAKDARIWMRSIRAHTYQGHPQAVGEVYLAHEEQVENILNLKFAVLDTPPKKATR